MRHICIALACALLLVSADATTAEWTVGISRTGPLRLGMRLTEVNRVLGERLAPPKIPAADPSGRCFQIQPTTIDGLALMFLDLTLVRIDVTLPGLKTIAGISVGDSEADVEQAYGRRLVREPHVYVEDGWYLRVLSDDGKRGLTFEIDGGRVTNYYVGTVAAVQWVEGCA